jgi:purine-binding chemotaxis protein CheW
MITKTEEPIPFKTSEAHQNLALFKLGRQIYALPVEDIVQIIPLVAIVRLPKAHQAVLGLINVRGTLTPVVSLSNLLGLPEPELRLHTPILLVRYRNYTLGTIVDDVVDVLAVATQDVEGSNDILPETLRNNSALVRLANTAKGTIFILDIARLLGDRQNEELLEALHTISALDEKKTETVLPAHASIEIFEEHEHPADTQLLSLPSANTSMKTEKKNRKKSASASASESDTLKSDPNHPSAGANED